MSSSWRKKLAFLSVSATLSLVGAELGLRWLLTQESELAATLRDPDRYADPLTDDDYWLLKHRWDPTYQTLRKTHPRLGWTKFADERQLHDDAAQVGDRRPVLLYGDSFAACTRGTRCFQDFLNEDPAFSAEHYLLNYGVGGFGVGSPEGAGGPTCPLTGADRVRTHTDRTPAIIYR